jgi:hypothetical protein
VPAYETGEFTPPAPVARARVCGPTGQTRSGVPLLIDTGADVSTIPRAVAEAVAAEVQASGILIRSFDGTETVCDLAELSVELLRYRFQGAFVIAEAEYGVVGRNVLNALLLTLDGPRQVWSA